MLDALLSIVYIERMEKTTAEQFLTVRTRTGKFSHAAFSDQRVTLCGSNLKAYARQMKVSGEPTCDKCQASKAGILA